MWPPRLIGSTQYGAPEDVGISTGATCRNLAVFVVDTEVLTSQDVEAGNGFDLCA